ncbi:hypothetical protein [Metabacillus sp. 84]
MNRTVLGAFCILLLLTAAACSDAKDSHENHKHHHSKANGKVDIS